MEWTNTSISVWVFPRASTGYGTFFSPNSTSSNTSTSHDPTLWDPPLAHFAGTGCDFSRSFKDMRIVFDTKFCGEWAGRDWGEGCAATTGVSSCEAYVRGNPGVFADAYWEVGALGWFEKGGGHGEEKESVVVRGGAVGGVEVRRRRYR